MNKVTNFERLYNVDKESLVDLLKCYQDGHSCACCGFGKYGLCVGGFEERETVEWLAEDSEVM